MVRVGVVGLGQIAELMLPPYVAHPDVEVVALCDRDESRLARWQAELPGAVATTDLDAFVARADLKRARDILAESANQGDWLDDDPFQAEEGYWPCPHCGDAVPESEAACPSCGTPLDDRPG